MRWPRGGEPTTRGAIAGCAGACGRVPFLQAGASGAGHPLGEGAAVDELDAAPRAEVAGGLGQPCGGDQPGVIGAVLR